MNRSGLSIPAKTVWAAGLACLLVVLGALVGHNWQRRADADAAYRHRVLGWVEMGAWQVSEAADSLIDPASAVALAEGDPARAREQFRRWSWSVLRYPETIQVLLVSREGAVMARVPDHIGVHGLDGILTSDTPWHRQTLRVGGTDRDVQIAMARVHAPRSGATIGRVVALTAVETPRPGDSIASVFTVVVGGAGALGLVLVAVWAWRSLGRPLSIMARPDSKQGPGWPDALPVDRDDELGAVAENLQRLKDRATRAETRAEALERNVHLRVADKTKRIEIRLEQAQKMAWVDSLTGLYNRRFMDEQLPSIFKEQRAANEDLTVVMLDVDHFKALNDTLGHSAGDDLLAFTGELLRASLRSGDIGIRHGGDEFAILMLGASCREGTALASRVVRLFSQKAALLKVVPPVTMSAGVASIRADRATDADHLMHLADAALYQAKGRGKNAVESASHPPVRP